MALPELLINSPIPGSREALTTLELELSESGTEMTWVANVPVSLQKAGQFRVVIGSEIILCEAKAEATKKVKILERGAEGSTKAIHTVGSKIFAVPTAEGLSQFLESYAGGFMPGMGEVVIDKPFTTMVALESEYEVDQGSTFEGLTVVEGEIKGNGVNVEKDHSVHHKTISVGPCNIIVHIKNSSPEKLDGAYVVRYVNEGKFLMTQYFNETLNVYAYNKVGVATLIGGTSASLLKESWLILRIGDNIVTSEIWEKDPRHGNGGLNAKFSHEMIGETLTNFGPGTEGKPGFRLFRGGPGGPPPFIEPHNKLSDFIVTKRTGSRHIF